MIYERSGPGLCAGGVSAGPSIVEMDIASLDPAEFVKSLSKQSYARLSLCIFLRSRQQNADAAYSLGLGARNERPGNR